MRLVSMRCDGAHAADIAIVGGGLVGTVIARQLLAAGARVVVLDAGSQMSIVPGEHLRNLPACRSDGSFYYDLLRANLRPVSVPRASSSLLSWGFPVAAEGNGINADQRTAINMAGARTTCLFGGMGALWNCIAPRFVEAERWDGIAASEWRSLYHRAEQALCVSVDASAGSRRQQAIVQKLVERYGRSSSASPRPAAVAGRRDAEGRFRWTGPAEILQGAVDRPLTGRIDILAEHVVRRLRHRGGRVMEAQALALDSGQEETVSADVFIVAAGGLRTPALLWASGIFREDSGGSPLGRYLYDHPLAYAQLALDPALVPELVWRGRRRERGGSRPDPDPFVIVPQSASHPFHSVLLSDGYDAGVLEGRVDERLLLSLYWYTPMEPRFENRIVLSDRRTDAIGLPQPSFEYVLSPEDRGRQQAALEDLRAAGCSLGRFLPTRPPQILSPGSSMHVMGTTRMGEADDGHSVVNAVGRVWGFSNLYLGGTGVIPSATATNPTLTACALGIHMSDWVAGTRGAAMPPRTTEAVLRDGTRAW